MDNIRLNLADEFSDEFKAKAERVPANAIGLPARALKIIFSSDIYNSYDALILVLNGFSGFSGVGAKTISESQAAVHQFIKIIESASESEINKLIDSREEHFASANGNLVAAFPYIVELYLSKKSKNNQKRDSDVLKKRFGLNGSKKYTLDDVGTVYDVTRERIRQIEAKSIKEIGFLLNGSLNQKGWKISNNLVAGYKNTCNEVATLEWISLKTDIENILRNQYATIFSQEYLDLFMEVCGYVKLPQSMQGFRGSLSESWIQSKKYKKSTVEAVFQALNIIYDSPKSISIFDLTIAAKKKRKTTITNNLLESALKATSDIDIDGEYAKVKFSKLRSAADKAVRILESHGKPVHFSKIAQEINLLNKPNSSSVHVKETNLKNQLVADKRFTPIGKSGEWELTEWGGLNNITIIQAIEKVLHTSGAPLKLAEIASEVSKLRPDASANSLTVYLNDQPFFVRVGKNEFALTTWRLKPAPKVIKKDSVTKRDFIMALYESLKVKNPIDFPELITAVKDKTKLGEIRVRQRITAVNGIEINSQNGKRCKVVFCSNPEKLVENVEETIPLLDRIHDEIRSILFQQPNIPIKKGGLYKKVVKSVRCKLPTLYRYLNLMTDIHQFKDGNYYAVYQHEEQVDRIEIDIDKFKAHADTKALLERPLSLLTVSNVDIALFELGLIFENRLKEYLLQQKDKGIIKVDSKDTSKLVHMIDCVVREKVIFKKHHLSTLREERNNRAHGKSPSVQERQDLFNKAHYISELFVKYICFFDQKI